MISPIKVNLPDKVGKGYGAFWRFEGRYRVVKGSRSSKKSRTTALNMIYRIMKYPESHGLVVRAVFNTLKDSCWATLKWATYRLEVSHLWTFNVSPLSATYNPTGQQILFRGLDDPDKLASIDVPFGHICFVWIEEAYEIDSEDDFDKLDDTIRGKLPEGYFHQLTLTFNPWSETWLRRRFFDTESPEIFAATTDYRCNEWLSEKDLERFERMKEQQPERYKVAGLGEWGVEGGAVFEEWLNDPEHYGDRVWTHVIDPFEVPQHWRIYRGFDFGYARPFSVGWWAADHDGRLYRILELYGCVPNQPDVGVKWTPDEIFDEIRRIEDEHRWLQGKKIYGVADPSIWNAQTGVSVAEIGERRGIYFERGDNKRLPGWMQMHYRLRFDEKGVPMMYIFNTCKGFIRTVPALKYDKIRPEDVDDSMEDHAGDECRYVCMARPITPKAAEAKKERPYDPLSTDDRYDRYEFYRSY